MPAATALTRTGMTGSMRSAGFKGGAGPVLPDFRRAARACVGGRTHPRGGLSRGSSLLFAA